MGGGNGVFRERTSDFSLKYREIRLLAVVGTRREGTRRGLRVGTGFREFPKTPRGRGFSLLGFYTLFKCFKMFRLVEALNGRLIGSKSWYDFETHE